MRLAIAVLAAVVVLGGSAVAVASSATNEDGQRRARAIAVLGETTGVDCDCTAGIRAKERIENGLADGEPGALGS
ncbi:MAG: hypothetical protein FJW81_08130 [Actinobacteria bacterium]|nr:hypothetical protein [Actinomycetota bacterium]